MKLVPPTGRRIVHYYGDQVRFVFFAVGMIMVVGLPFFKDFVPQPLIYSVIGILILAFLAGLTNPKQVWIIFFDLIVSLFGFVIFEFYALSNSNNLESIFFLTTQIIAVLFLTAFYYSTKTVRGFYLRNK